MRITIDTEAWTLVREGQSGRQTLPLFSDEAFAGPWVKIGWNQKYATSFSWLGRPIIQLPEDRLRIQEVIYRLKPDVIIEAGIAHGSSLIFSASLCKLQERGRVIGVDIEESVRGTRITSGDHSLGTDEIEPPAINYGSPCRKAGPRA